MATVELFNKRKSELAKLVSKWWTHEDVFTDFQEMINELKAMAAQCPDAFEEQFQLEVLEIETALREDCLID